MTLPKSILIPVIRFTPSGGTRVLCCLASEWATLGIDAAFLVLDGNSQPSFPTAAKIIRAGDIDARWARPSPGLLSPLTEVARLAAALRRVSTEFDILLGNHAFPTLACSLAGVAHKTLYYVQAYDPEILRARGRLTSWIASGIARLSYPLCPWQVTNSPHYFSYPGIRARAFIPPGIDTAVFHPRAFRPLPQHGPLQVGIIGRTEPHKYRPVLDAYRAMCRREPRCHLRVAYGNIPDAELRRCGEYTVVTPRSDEDLAAFYRSCDVFLALTEFPQGAFYPPLEALASGTPLISNRFLCVTPENSWPIDDAADVDRAFDELLACDDSALRRQVERGIADIQQGLQWRGLASRFLDLMEEGPPKKELHSARMVS